MNVSRSALVAQPATLLFDVIESAEHYPQFLPWCTGATILARDDAQVSAELRMRVAGFDFALRTENPKQRPVHMAIHLQEGPFRRFEGDWQLTALTEQACKIVFALDWEFDSPLLTQIAGPVFGRIADSMVDAFVQRAQRLVGG